MSTAANYRQNAADCVELAANTKSPAQAEMDAMTAAFSNALHKLEVRDLTDPIADFVGRKIIRAALAGENDPTVLCDRAIEGQSASPRRQELMGHDRSKA
jgi:hypothetical protein